MRVLGLLLRTAVLVGAMALGLSLWQQARVQRANDDLDRAMRFFYDTSRMQEYAEGAVLDALRRGADIHYRDEVGLTVLMHAARMPSPALVEKSLAAGVDVNAREFEGRTALHAAFYDQPQPSLRVVSLLLDAGAEVNASRYEGGQTALHFAVSRGSADIVRLLLRSGADPNALSSAFGTPLIEAAHMGNLEIAEDLLASGADPALVWEGKTAREHALAEGHADVAARLR